jgi:hypothetical protein
MRVLGTRWHTCQSDSGFYFYISSRARYALEIVEHACQRVPGSAFWVVWSRTEQAGRPASEQGR